MKPFQKATPEFEKDLAAVLNKHSIENWSDTPDWVLANYLVCCLYCHQTATQARDALRKTRENLEL